VSEAGYDIAIVTDSTCDIPAELIQRYDLTVVPLYVLWGDEELQDGVDIDQKSFFERLPQDPIHPQTSQPTPGDFVRAMEGLDAQEVLVITLSKALSGTYESAIQARQQLDVPVRVVDSYSMSMGLGWQVLAAAEVREEGGDIEAMIAAAERVRERLSLLLTVDTLEYLHRGGRIGGAAKLVGSLVKLKPLLEIDHESGSIDAVEKIRTRKRSLQQLLDETFRRIDPERPTKAAVMHGAAPDAAEWLRAEVESRCAEVEIIQRPITPVLGVHGGPGVVGIAAYSE